MTFLVEDGTGIAGANSYCDVPFANNYFLERGVTAWAGATPVKQSALIRATDYVELRFSNLFIGDKLGTVQSLSFPRVSAGLAVPMLMLQRATCEYALRSLSFKLLPDPEVHASGQGLERLREKVGPIETENRFQYQGPGTQRIILRPYPAADNLLKDIIKTQTGGVIRG